jgi:hypothetical protein
MRPKGVAHFAERKAAFDGLDERGRQRSSASGYLTKPTRIDGRMRVGMVSAAGEEGLQRNHFRRQDTSP